MERGELKMREILRALVWLGLTLAPLVRFLMKNNLMERIL